jgi:hypothetical protein
LRGCPSEGSLTDSRLSSLWSSLPFFGYYSIFKMLLIMFSTHQIVHHFLPTFSPLFNHWSTTARIMSKTKQDAALKNFQIPQSAEENCEEKN